MKLIFSTLFYFSFCVLFAQKYTDKAVKQSCDCMNKLDPNLAPKALEAAVSKCIETAALANMSGLVDEYKMDLGDEAAAEKIGEKIGMKLVAKCPVFIELAQKFPDDEKEEDADKYEFVEGKVTTAVKSDFLTITVEETSGDIRVFYLIEYFSGAEEITADLNKLKNKKVKIGYVTKQIFDKESNEFKERKVMVAFEYWN
jgi:hypothetical protein